MRQRPTSPRADTSNWGPETHEFSNLFSYLRNKKGVRVEDIMLAAYSLTHPRYWTTSVPWKRAKQRFYVEQALVYLRVYKLLEATDSRHEFLDKIGLRESEADALAPSNFTRRQYPAIAARLGKEKEYQQLITPAPDERSEIQP